MTTTKRSWDEVEADVVDNVFYAYDPADVRASQDLAKAGMLDSLSIVAIMEILAESSDNEDGLNEAQAADFRNLTLIRALYERL